VAAFAAKQHKHIADTGRNFFRAADVLRIHHLAN
jgi:hypothetical protein